MPQQQCHNCSAGNQDLRWKWCLNNGLQGSESWLQRRVSQLWSLVTQSPPRGALEPGTRVRPFRACCGFPSHLVGCPEILFREKGKKRREEKKEKSRGEGQGKNKAVFPSPFFFFLHLLTLTSLATFMARSCTKDLEF